jgi:hypothetical protein
MARKLNREKLNKAGLRNTYRTKKIRGKLPFTYDDAEIEIRKILGSKDSNDYKKAQFNDTVIQLQATNFRQLVGGSNGSSTIKMDYTWSGTSPNKIGYGWILPLTSERMSNTSSNNDEFTLKKILWKSTGVANISAANAYKEQTPGEYNNFSFDKYNISRGAFITPHDDFYIDRLQVMIRYNGNDLHAAHQGHLWRIKVFAGAFWSEDALAAARVEYSTDGNGNDLSTDLLSSVRTRDTNYANHYLAHKPQAPRLGSGISGATNAECHIQFISTTLSDYNGKYIKLTDVTGKTYTYTFDSSDDTVSLGDVGIASNTTVEHMAQDFATAVGSTQGIGYTGLSRLNEILVKEAAGGASNAYTNLMQYIPGSVGNTTIETNISNSALKIWNKAKTVESNCFTNGNDPYPDNPSNISYVHGGKGKFGHQYGISVPQSMIGMRGFAPQYGATDKDGIPTFQFEDSEEGNNYWYDSVNSGTTYANAGGTHNNILIATSHTQVFNTGGSASHQGYHFIDIPIKGRFTGRGVPIWALIEPLTHESDADDGGWSGNSDLECRTFVFGGERGGPQD